MNTPESGERDGKVVQRLDEFPQLLEALRDGDLLTARLFCAQLFGIDQWKRSDTGQEPRARRRFDHDRKM
jgi:hypothetical protein